MKNNFFLSGNGNILVVSEQNFFMTPNGDFIRLVSQGEADNLIKKMNEISFENIVLPEIPYWKFLWAVRGQYREDSLIPRKEQNTIFFFIRINGEKIEYIKLTINTPVNVSGEKRMVNIMGMKRKLTLPLWEKEKRNVIDQIGQKVNYEEALNAVGYDHYVDIDMDIVMDSCYRYNTLTMSEKSYREKKVKNIINS